MSVRLQSTVEAEGAVMASSPVIPRCSQLCLAFGDRLGIFFEALLEIGPLKASSRLLHSYRITISPQGAVSAEKRVGDRTGGQ